MKIEPFTININQTVLDDLQARLEHTRWPDQPQGADWSLGTNLEFMQSLTHYWLKTYDWRKTEKELNEFNHYQLKDTGADPLHFIHEKSTQKNAVPILLVHGWPDSFYRYHKVINDLSETFHVVVPSIPGMGFSGKTALPMDEVADRFLALMNELGYDKFLVAGGDSGSIICMSLAQRHPEAVLGYHVTDVGYPDHTTDFAALSEPEQAYAGALQQWFMQHGAFNLIHASKPQSLAFAMTDSPIGLAAWIMSFMAGMGLGDEAIKRFGRDELITNIMIHWVTETVASSFRIYSVGMMNPPTITGDVTSVPVAVATEVPIPGGVRLPRQWADRQTGGNIVQFHDMPLAGHFAPWEDPKYYVQDIRSFAEILQS